VGRQPHAADCLDDPLNLVGRRLMLDYEEQGILLKDKADKSQRGSLANGVVSDSVIWVQTIKLAACPAGIKYLHLHVMRRTI